MDRAWLARRLAGIARWVPARLRATFDDELEDVFSTRLDDAAAHGWLPLFSAALLELLLLPGLHIRERLRAGKGGSMQTGMLNGADLPRPPLPWRWALTGTLPFLYVVLALLYANMMQILYDQSGASFAAGREAFLARMYDAGYIAALMVYMLVLIAGWVRGFPVWAYPFAAQFFFLYFAWFSEYDPSATILAFVYRWLGQLFQVDYASPGMRILGNLLWLLNWLIPLGFIAGVSLYLTRKDRKRPLQAGLDALSRDLTRVSLGAVSLAPLFILIVWDGLPGPGLIGLLPHVLLAAGALAYYRSTRLSLGVVGLMGGLLLAYVSGILLSGVQWAGVQASSEPNTTSLQEVMACVFPIFMFALGPWLIHRYNHRVQHHI